MSEKRNMVDGIREFLQYLEIEKGRSTLLGHANMATTQIYTHVTDSHFREVHKKFHSRK